MQLGTNLVSQKKRIVGLDILRSVAILLVMHEHGGILLPNKFIKYFILPRPSIDGVSIFFVLSGFLIGGILLRTIQNSKFTIKNIVNFWIRRWLRTIPNYYFVLLILIFFKFLIEKNINGFNYRFLIFSQNLYQPHPAFFSEAWSLSIEEWFYLTFPAFAFLLYKTLNNKNKSVILAAIFFIILPLILRIIKYNLQIESTDWDLNFRKIIILRLDSIMYGVIGAYISIFNLKFWKKYKSKGLILSISIITFLILYSLMDIKSESFIKVYHFNLESIAGLCSLPFFSDLTSIKYKQISKIFTFISLISYSMYLVNLSLVRDLFIPLIINSFGWAYNHSLINNLIIHFSKFFLFWILTITTSYLLYTYFESPILKFRDRINIAR